MTQQPTSDAPLAPWLDRRTHTGHETAQALAGKLNESNWREHPDNQADAVDESLDALGWVGSVKVNSRSGRLIDGHLRVKRALLKDPQAQIPVDYYDLTEEEENLTLQVLDASTEMATPNAAKLAALMERTKEMTANRPALRGMLDALKARARVNRQEAVREVEPQVDKAAELQEKWGTELGQVWKLGKHLIFCGGAAEAKIECRIAIYDPPFEWSWQQQDHALSWSRWETAILMGLHYCMPLVQRHDFCHWWIWDSGMSRFGGRGYKPMSACAIVLVFGEKRNWYESQALAALDRAEVEHYDWPVQIVKIQDSLAGREIFSHQKPYALYDYIVSLYSKEGDIVGDPFAGSGGFLIACENLGREYHGSEILPKNVAIILERFYQIFNIEPQLC